MEQFRNIGIIGRLGSSQVLDTIRRLKRFLVERHLHVILEENIAEVLPGHGMQTSSRQRLGESCDLVIVVGGDGSLLGAARAMARHRVPVLGINRGSLGFLTDIRPDELEEKVAEVLNGQYTLENRFLLEAQARRFEFHPGPVFTHVLLADEINRAPPRTQSALLEAMAEHQVSIDGQTRTLPDPFLVIATQNPVDLAGTYPLPDSQLDRFLLRLALGYPDESAERALLAGSDRRDLIAQAAPLLDAQRVIALRRMVLEVHASEPLIAYVQALVGRSRKHPGVRVGLSPRAGLALLRAARAHALLLGRSHAIPEDVQALFAAVAEHRLVGEADTAAATLAKAILHAVPVD